MALDVGEAARQLRSEKTAVVQCADGELCFLREVNESEAVGEPLDGGDERTHATATLRQVTGYDSDEDGLRSDGRVAKARATNAKRPRPALDSPATHRAHALARPSAADRERSAVERMLCKAFPHVGPFGTAELEAALRELEKYELVCQGDDYADVECLSTNSEALQARERGRERDRFVAAVWPPCGRVPGSG